MYATFWNGVKVRVVLPKQMCFAAHFTFKVFNKNAIVGVYRRINSSS